MLVKANGDITVLTLLCNQHVMLLGYVTTLMDIVSATLIQQKVLEL